MFKIIILCACLGAASAIWPFHLSIRKNIVLPSAAVIVKSPLIKIIKSPLVVESPVVYKTIVKTPVVVKTPIVVAAHKTVEVAVATPVVEEIHEEVKSEEHEIEEVESKIDEKEESNEVVEEVAENVELESTKVVETVAAVPVSTVDIRIQKPVIKTIYKSSPKVIAVPVIRKTLTTVHHTPTIVKTYTPKIVKTIHAPKIIKRVYSQPATIYKTF